VHAAVPPHSNRSLGIVPVRSSSLWRHWWITCLPPVLTALSSLAAHGQAPSPCPLDTIALATVRAVADGRTVLLEDGREVRLADIEVPGLAQGDAGRAAKAALEALVTGRTIALKQSKPERDRHGRMVAYIFVTRDGGERSVARDMIALGHARVAGRVVERSCLPDLLASERLARTAKRGVWSDSAYAIRQAEKPAEVLAEKGRFALVEGRVLSVRESGATIYVNFGRQWTEDFTVTVLKRNERAFAAAGMEPKKLAGRRIRVRGWVEERGGPWIEATRPEQIEILDGN
jgi:endonuclease YncB( thermonuclease family)